VVGPFGYYRPPPMGDSGDSEVVCGPYGCYWNEATAYLPKLVLARKLGKKNSCFDDDIDCGLIK